MTVFTATAAAQVTGVGLRSILDWARRGFLQAAVKETTGQGDRRIYSESNLVQMLLLRKFFAMHLTREQVGALLQQINLLPLLDPRRTTKGTAIWCVVLERKVLKVSYNLSQDIPASTVEGIIINLTALKQEIVAKL